MYDALFITAFVVCEGFCGALLSVKVSALIESCGVYPGLFALHAATSLCLTLMGFKLLLQGVNMS